jgi:translation elongation factor EF-1alpha
MGDASKHAKESLQKMMKKTDDKPLDVHFVPCSTLLGKTHLDSN